MTFYGIYKITNLANGKMYIGQHVTSNLDDGYMGSGLRICAAISQPRPYRKGISTWNKGLSMTDSQKAKISTATKNAMTDEVRHKISEANRNRKGKVYWNNGKVRKLAAECPGKGWVRGRALKTEMN